MDVQRIRHWHSILKLTESMLSTANQGEWNELQEMAKTREGLLHSFFESSVSPEEAKQVKQGIERIFFVDKEIYQLAKSKQKEIGQQLSDLTKSKQAKQAYLQNSKLPGNE